MSVQTNLLMQNCRRSWHLPACHCSYSTIHTRTDQPRRESPCMNLGTSDLSGRRTSASTSYSRAPPRHQQSSTTTPRRPAAMAMPHHHLQPSATLFTLKFVQMHYGDSAWLAEKDEATKLEKVTTCACRQQVLIRIPRCAST